MLNYRNRRFSLHEFELFEYILLGNSTRVRQIDEWSIQIELPKCVWLTLSTRDVGLLLFEIKLVI